MIKKYFLIIFLLVLISIPLWSEAQVPFGGTVVSMQPCNSGLLIYVLTPLSGTLPFMWFTGELPYMMHTPPHIGQNILGMAAPAPAPCMIGMFSYGAGMPIIFHGSSI